MPQLVRAIQTVLVAGLLTPLTPLSAIADVGRWRFPLEGSPRVARPFAPPALPYGPGHRGVDLLAAPGASVRAAADGTIRYAGWVAGRPVVALAHGELATTYEPVSPAVRVGARVRAGDVVGHLVEVGDHCPAPGVTCLHWGVRRGSAYLDPLALLRRGPLRLLPLSGAPGAVGPLQPLPAAPPKAATADRAAPASPVAAAAASSAVRSEFSAERSGAAPASARTSPALSQAPKAAKGSPLTRPSLLLAPLAAAGAAAIVFAVPRRSAAAAPSRPAAPRPAPTGVVDLARAHARRRAGDALPGGDPGDGVA